MTAHAFTPRAQAIATTLGLIALALIALAFIVLDPVNGSGAALAMAIPAFTRADAALTRSVALPASAGSVYTEGINLQSGPNDHHLAPMELLIEAPALATGLLPDTKTAVYVLQHDDDPEFSSPVDLQTVLTQTGAGGEGADAASKRVRLPHDVKQHVRLKITTDASADASGATATLKAMF